MEARFTGSWGTASRLDRALTLGLLLALLAIGSASAEPGTPNKKGPAHPTSIGFVPARSRMFGPSPPACGGRGPASATPAGLCSSSE